ncbi:LpxA family transferase [Bradyrhizobium guangdongense]
MKFATEYISRFVGSPIAALGKSTPWELTSNSADAISRLLVGLESDHVITNGVAVHRTATIEVGATIKGPAIVGAHCFIAATSLIRAGCWIDESCVIGPGCELKSSFLFRSCKLAHFNFIGDSILGSDINLEAGCVIANYRNELPGSSISFTHDGHRIDTGVSKFGALIGDGCKVGANAVIAPGAALRPKTIVQRLALVDQQPS